MHPSTVLAIQSWTLYSIAISLISSRMYVYLLCPRTRLTSPRISRRITLGSIKVLQADDWLMALVLIPFTATIVLVNHVSNGQSTKQRKFRYVLEEIQLITLWLVRACLLVLYWRIFPVEKSPWRRRALKGISAFCGLSFLVVQISLIAWCQPIEAHWDLPSPNSQCTTYLSHTAITLAFNIPNTILIMMLPVPFIPTPRRLLLAILLILGMLVLTAGILSRSSILKASNPSSSNPVFLRWYICESTLSLIFANIPFLTSLVVATAPARIRYISQHLRTSSHLALIQWPRSRRGSWTCSTAGSYDSTRNIPPLRMNRSGSTTTMISELPSPIDVEKGLPVWRLSEPATRKDLGATRDSASSDLLSRGGAVIRSSMPELQPSSSLLLSSSVAERVSTVPKTRLSGGLAEMGGISTDNTEGWPIYWK
ncbi:uncharacterized protein K460DRAFT_55127 [Cucurbitaria berberidis CBS 394.84]|uniref:Rhodopsin domain-containing protein n=1 Tax=Cucurbitaria berberidis CBS 394.84 TaxID=1168544 RepID=A0A9P4L9H8_9PLEO|nr:uncharacterized protein K460DRAFT_55127 [Cucurbitaria berberidis CBS 394.84]KAF1847206.1 hypothetical protein K460DRAFT_55127 [Cucurbitaria berberidis CBS 394.84]